MFSNHVVVAFAVGLVSAASLPLGALLGTLWRPLDRTMAFLLAFGGGALLAALTLDLVDSALERGHFYSLAAGAVLGGLIFKVLDHLVNRKGGFLRKPSTAINYWRGKAHQRLRQLLSALRRIDFAEELSAEDIDKLLPIVLVRQYPPDTVLYRTNDPAENLYIIEKGEVDLLDPQKGRRPFEHLSPKDTFGRLSFFTGAPRATEAITRTDVRLLVIPRTPFFELAEHVPSLRAAIEEKIGDPEVRRYLEQRHGMSAEQIDDWLGRALVQSQESGRFESPVRGLEPKEDLKSLLKNIHRVEFFRGLGANELEQVGQRLILKPVPKGHTFFHLGELADRLYVLRQGKVSLFDPDDPSRRPTVVEPGEAFGAFSFFTEGSHTVTAAASEDSEAYVLRHKDFEELVQEHGGLRQRLVDFLKLEQVAEYLTRKQKIDSRKAAAWMNRAVKSVQRGQLFPSVAEMTKAVGTHKGAAMAIFLGITLDGVPESLVIGANALVHSHVSMSLIAGLFLSNFPEALSSAAGMREQGFKVAKIMTMWTLLMLMTGLGAGFGAIALAGAPPFLFALIEGVAAGAMLTVIAETMLPEAFLKGSGIVGLSTLLGFLTAIFFSSLE